jgi:hypothetical protein
VNTANIQMLEFAAAALAELPDEVVFVGGATDELWATDEAVPEFRPTVLVDGRAELVAEVEAAAPELRAFIGIALSDLLSHHVFDSAGEGVLRGGPETQERFELSVKPRIESIAVATSDVQPGTTQA